MKNKSIFSLLALASLWLSQTGCASNANKTTEEAAQTATEVEEAAPAIEQSDDDMAPDFTLKDIQGKDFSLSSLRGKYVVLDFWGSWCPWCLRGLPKMKEYYAKYKGKLEIVGIDCQETEEEWKECVEENKIPWIHVYNPTTSDALQRAYGLQGYPHKVVISPEGRVLKAFIGEVPEFYPFLDEVLGGK